MLSLVVMVAFTSTSVDCDEMHEPPACQANRVMINIPFSPFEAWAWA